MAAQYQAFLYPEKVRDSARCGCYHCETIFDLTDIEEWLRRNSKSIPIALCPLCRQDAVIGDALGFPVTEELLKAMRDYCYEPDEWRFLIYRIPRKVDTGLATVSYDPGLILCKVFS